MKNLDLQVTFKIKPVWLTYPAGLQEKEERLRFESYLNYYVGLVRVEIDKETNEVAKEIWDKFVKPNEVTGEKGNEVSE